MEHYTASNGVTVRMSNHLGIVVKDGTLPNTVVASKAHELALREFFRAEEDERLGLWRSVNNPKYTVSRKTKDELVISHEDGRWWYYHSGPGGHPTTEEIAAVAHEYFDTHPEPKPWHDAKPGEVWLLRIPTGPTFDHAPAVVSSSANGNAIFTAATYDAAGTEELALNAPQITYATRIWPEESS